MIKTILEKFRELIHRLIKRPFLGIAVVMFGFGGLIWASLHNFGFWGDCWFVLFRPYFMEPLEAVKSHADRFGRPGEVLYYIPMLKIAGFQAKTWLLVSFFWLGAASLLCGGCLRRSFPDLKFMHVGVPLLIFFSGAMGPLVYRMDVDQGRLCLLFFWLSTTAYQYYVLRRNKGLWRTFPLLVLAGLAYLYSLLCYEATIILFVSLTLLLLPLWLAMDMRFRLKTALEIGGMMILIPAIYLVMRYQLFGGGKDKPLRNIPRLDGYPEAARNALEYLVAPFYHIQWDFEVGLVFISALGVIGYLLWNVQPPAKTFVAKLSPTRQAVLALVFGLIVFAAGASPFLLGKYQYDRVEFTGHSRILVASWYGFAIMILGICSMVRRPHFQRACAVLLATVLSAGGALVYDLHRDWETVSDINARMWHGFFEQVPDVQSKSFFIFRDLYASIPVSPGTGNRASVFIGFNGLRDFIRIAYDEQKLAACYLFTDAARTRYPRYQMVVRGDPAGVISPGTNPNRRPFPANRYILVQREGYELKLVDRWIPETAGSGIVWEEGATELTTRVSRIRSLSEGDERTPEDRVRQLGYRLPPPDYVIPEVKLR